MPTPVFCAIVALNNGSRILLVVSFIFLPSLMCLFSCGFATWMDIVIGLGYLGSSSMWYCLLMGRDGSALILLALLWTL